jgi:succinyl-diaminopimelate desuccinylase
MVPRKSYVPSFFEKVDAGKGELVDLLVKLVKAKSENPPGDTTRPAYVAEEYLSGYGFSVKKYEAEKGVVNLVASVGSGDELAFCGHIDTVPAGNESRWTQPAFGGKIVGGKVYGRGATDMKAGCASLAFAFAQMAKVEGRLTGRLVLALVADEETGGRRGVQYLIDNGVLRPKNLILGEPTNHKGTGRVVVAGEKGVYWVRVTFEGSPRHGSLPMLGDNAIMKAKSVLEAFSSPFLGKVTIPYEAASLVRATKKILKVEYASEASKKPHYAADHYTVNVGVIGGGTKVNVVPDSCSVELDIRIPLGGSREEADRLLTRHLPKDAQVEVLNYATPAFTPPSSPLVKTTREAGRRVFNEETPAMCLTATTDAHHFRAALGTHAVSYGPGLESGCHVLDENVDVSEVIGASKVYLSIVDGMLLQ